MNYNKLNNLIGWSIWLVASYVYLSTMEPSVSFWDCGEFISSAYNLEIGHPPGAPMYMLIGRVFSMFFSPQYVALSVNALSALASSFTILFLFWTTTYLLKKLVQKRKEDLTLPNQIIIFGSAMVASLAFTFSDTFWFSAVEAEVYASSSMITALVFWVVLKWERESDKVGNERWIVLIAFIIGLSIGVHLLCLLAIPAVTFVVYLKHKTFNSKNILLASFYSILLLGIVQFVIILKTYSLASYFELFFVNTLDLPFNLGLIVYSLLIFGLVILGIVYSHKKQSKLLNTAMVSLLVMFIGYSTYAVILIRSSANPPMDENNPENVFSLIDYLSREQYGSAPVLFGQSFNTPLDGRKPYIKGKDKYYQDKENNKYLKYGDDYSSVPNFDKKSSVFLPRMYSFEPKHVRGYKEWIDFKGRSVRTSTGQKVVVPTLSENLKFLFKYQLGFMYWRYFMWNFVGRQNDIQGFGNKFHGNWLSGIKFIDEMRLGNQSEISDFYKDNKGRNSYYFLPFILGFIGFLFHFKQSKKDWLALFLFFFFTGIAIHLFVNTPPFQPRERDYAYVGSFYIFAIWIGFGVYTLYNFIRSKIKTRRLVPISLAVTFITFLAVPVIMANENYDDHNRSNGYMALDFSKNYLNSCDKDAILFTNGDNDTFPLWYLQEVENYRTDVRIVNLSLLNTDWYTTQIRRAAWEGKPVKGIIPMQKIIGRKNEMLPVVSLDNVKGHVDLFEVLNFIKDDSRASKIELQSKKLSDYFPTKKFKLKVNKQNCLKVGIINPKDSLRVLDEIKWEIGNNYYYKRDLLALDLIAATNWERPIYFAVTSGDKAFMGLQKYFSQEGLVYKLVPYQVNSFDQQIGEINNDVMYDKIMNKFKWGVIDKEEVYLNENNLRMIMNFKNVMTRLAMSLVIKGDKEKAEKVLDRIIEVFDRNVPYDVFTLSCIEGYYKLEKFDKGDEVAVKIVHRYLQDLDYYASLDSKMKQEMKDEIGRAKYAIQQALILGTNYFKDKSKVEELLSKDLPKINRYLSSPK